MKAQTQKPVFSDHLEEKNNAVELKTVRLKSSMKFTLFDDLKKIFNFSEGSLQQAVNTHAVIQSPQFEPEPVLIQTVQQPETVKMVLVGPASGKSALVYRYIYPEKLALSLPATIGVNIYDKKALEKFNLKIWDTAGQKPFQKHLERYLKSAKIVIFCVSFQQELASLQDYINLVNEKVAEDILKIMVCTKKDTDKKIFSFAEAQQYAESQGFASCFECSAKTGEDVEVIFKATLQLYEKNNELAIAKPLSF